jgi:hypothetical protein
MARFSKRKPDTVIVKDRKLVCPVCDNDQFINLVRKTTSLQGVAIRTNLLISDIPFDNIKWCSTRGCYEVT